MLRYWIRPAAAALFWIAVAGSTVAELTTIGPSLEAARARTVGGPAHPAASVAAARRRPRGDAIARSDWR